MEELCINIRSCGTLLRRHGSLVVNRHVRLLLATVNSCVTILDPRTRGEK